MAMWTEKTFRTKQDMLDYLNDVMIGTVDLSGGADVDNKTFIVDVAGGGNRTVTFQPAKSRDWTLAEILAEIQGTHDDLQYITSYSARRDTISARADAPALDIRLKVFGDGIVTVRGNGTANAELGFTEGATPGDDTVNAPIADTAVERIDRNIQGQDNWTVVVYV